MNWYALGTGMYSRTAWVFVVEREIKYLYVIFSLHLGDTFLCLPHNFEMRKSFFVCSPASLGKSTSILYSTNVISIKSVKALG